MATSEHQGLGAARLDLPPRLARRIGQRLRLARLALIWERLWPALWPALAVIGSFLAVALFDLLPGLGGIAHAVVLALFALGLALTLWQGMRRLRLPDLQAARRRVESASGFEHRPLTQLGDEFVGRGDDPLTQALWQVNRRRLIDRLRRLRVGVPAAGLARIDPWGLRAVLGLVLVLALVDSSEDRAVRLARALTPNLAGVVSGAVTLDIWVSPPAYTGLPPVLLDMASAKAGQTVQIPTRSTVLAQVNGGSSPPSLQVGDQVTPFESVGPASHRVQASITQGSDLVVARGHSELGHWHIQVLPEHAPTIAFRNPPSQTDRAALKLDYTASDEYGIETVQARIRRVYAEGQKRPEGEEAEEVIELALPLPGVGLKQAQSASFHDLTAHIWAGLPVEAVLIATNVAGLTGESEAQTFTLPERMFAHPVARAIVAERRRLTTEPEKRSKVIEALGEIAARPGTYYDDVVTFLSLKSAVGRLSLDETKEGLAAVQQLLWETALRIEDGEVSTALRELRQAEQRLEEALARNADDAELQRLMEELQRALDQYLDAMMRQMEQQQQANPQDMQKLPPNAQLMSRQDLQNLMDRAREMLKSGNREAARQMLSQLREMLENLRAAQPQMGDPKMQQGMKMLQNLQDLARRQRQLMDQTYQDANRQNQQSQQGQQGQMGQQGQQGQRGQRGQPGQQGQNGAESQEAMRRMLGELMRQMGEMGEIPQPFGRAERAMKEAAEALQRAQPGEAVGPQGEALDQLQQGAQALADQLANQMAGSDPGNNSGQGRPAGTRPGQARQDGRDPLGRSTRNSAGMDQGDVEIPKEADLQRAREIFDELRRRAGEAERPAIEREYIDRLLRRF